MKYLVLGSVLLLLSLVVDPTDSIWLEVDWGAYISLQSVFAHWPEWRATLALLSTKWGNWVMLSCMVTAFVPWLVNSTRAQLVQKLAAISLYILVFFIGLRLIDRWLVAKFLGIARWSPSAIIPSWIDVSYAWPGLFAKVVSKSSFPSDHGMQHALLWLWSMHYCKSYSPVVLLIGIIFNLPRLATGAHWLSDVLVGGLGIAMLLYAFCIVGPLGRYLEKRFESIWRPLLGLPAKPAINSGATI